MSESNQIIVRYVPEVIYGTTPVDDPGWKLIPQNDEGLGSNPITVESQRIRGVDRMPADQVTVNLETAGNTDFELSYGDFDDFIEAAMCGTWATDAVTLGNDDKSFSIEKEFSDLSTPKFILMRGMRVGQLDLNFTFGQLVTGTVMFMGSTSAEGESSAVGTGSVAALSGNDIMAANVDMDSVTYDGTSIASSGIEIESISMSINNNLRPRNNIISQSPTDQRKGTGRITGTIRAYVSTAAWDLYQKMLANAATSLVWTITDGTGKGYTFNLPNIKLSGQAPSGSGIDTDAMVEANFLAIQTAPTITRIP